MAITSLMEEEALSAPSRVAALLLEGATARASIAAALRADPPPLAVTVGRGSSDHVCSFAAWTIARHLLWPTMSLQPSLITREGSGPRIGRALTLAVSQSGRGADVIGVMEWARSAGSRTVALVNDPLSPLAAAAEFVLDQHAGPEQSVAATKSVICSMAAVLALVAEVADASELRSVSASLQHDLAMAAKASLGLDPGQLTQAEHAFVLARGAGLAAAEELALKLKETCGLSAEALSAAEVRHGPREVVGPGFLVIALALPGPAEHDVRAAAEELAAQGAHVILLGAETTDSWCLPTVHPASAPIAALQLAYPVIARAAVARGRDPDRPRTLSKVTSTF